MNHKTSTFNSSTDMSRLLAKQPMQKIRENKSTFWTPQKIKMELLDILTKENTACVHVLVMLLVPKQQQNTR